MLSVHQTLRSNREWLVVVVPVGAIARDKFLRYLGFVRRQSQTELRENASYFGKNKFLNRNWEQDKICVNFESWDNVHKSDWEELQLHRKIVGIIGIADCGAEEKLEVTYQAFLKATAPYLEWVDPNFASNFSSQSSSGSESSARPRASSDSRPAASGKSKSQQQAKVPRLCLAFEPRTDQTEIDSNDFKMIPNQDDAHVEFYVKHMLLIELVAPILGRLNDQFEAMAEILEKADTTLHGSSMSLPNPTTPLDSDSVSEEKMALALASSSKKRKRRAARLRKQYADIALLGGSPVDAVNLYSTAMDLSKNVSDWEWAAAAIEGYVSAKLLSLQTVTEDASKELVDKLHEALGYYRLKKAEMLEIELSVKFARFLVEAGRKVEAAELLTSTYTAAHAMSTQEKIRLSSAIATIFQSAGMQRKFAFYMREMAALCSSILPFAKSHQLVTIIAELYGIEAHNKISPSHFHHPSDWKSPELNSPDSTRSRKQVVMDTGVRWTRLRSAVLTALLNLASQTGDTLQTIKYLIYMLREIVPEEIQLNHDAPLDSSPLVGNSRLDTIMGTFGIGSSQNSPTTQPSAIPTNRSLVAASSVDLDYIQMLKEKTAQIPPVFLHAMDPKHHRSGLGIAGNILPVVDSTVFLKVSKHVVDPLFLFRPKKFTKAGQEAEKELPIAYTWQGNTSFFTIDVHNPYSVELCIEKMSIRLVPLVVTQISRGKFDISIDPNIGCDASNETGPVCRATLPPKSAMTLKIPVVIPKISNAPFGSTQKTILLLPSHLDYTVFNCHFQERLDTVNVVPDVITLAWAMPRTMRLLSPIPRLLALEVSHQWNSNAEAHVQHIKPKNADEPLHPAIQSMEQLPQPSGAISSSVLDLSASLFPYASQSTSNSVVKLDSEQQDTNSPLIQIQLLRGEEYTSMIRLINDDPIVDIDEINVDILENGVSFQQAASDMAQQGSAPCNISSPQLEATFADMIQIIRKSLPIKPKQSITLPLRILADKFTSTIAFTFEYRSASSEQDIYRRAQCVFSYSQRSIGLQISNVSLLKPAQMEIDLGSLGEICPSAQDLVHSAAGLTVEDAHLLCVDFSNTSGLSFDVFASAPFEGTVDPTKVAFAPLRLHTTPPTCPLCNKDTVLRRGQMGTFLNCIAYPECHFFRENPEPVDNGDSLRPSMVCKSCKQSPVPRFGPSGLVWHCPTEGCTSKPVPQSDLARNEWNRLDEGAIIRVPAWATARMIVPIHPAILQREMIEEMRRALVVPMSIVVGAPKLAKRKVPPAKILMRAALKWLLRFQWRCANRSGYVSTDGAVDLLSSPSLLEAFLPPPCRVYMSLMTDVTPSGGSLRVRCNELVTIRVNVERLPTTLPLAILEASGNTDTEPRFTVSVVCSTATLEEQRGSSWLPTRITWIGKNLNLDLPNPVGIRESLSMTPSMSVPCVDVSFLIHAPGDYQFTASAIDVATHQTYWSMPIRLLASTKH